MPAPRAAVVALRRCRRPEPDLQSPLRAAAPTPLRPPAPARRFGKNSGNFAAVDQAVRRAGSEEARFALEIC